MPVDAPPQPVPAMTHRRALWMGVAAFAPLALLPVMLGLFLLIAVTDNLPPQGRGFPLWILPLLGLQGFASVCSVAAIVFTIFDVFRHPRLAERERPLWVILLVFSGLVASPIYWFVYVRPYLRTPAA